MGGAACWETEKAWLTREFAFGEKREGALENTVKSRDERKG